MKKISIILIILCFLSGCITPSNGYDPSCTYMLSLRISKLEDSNVEVSKKIDDINNSITKISDNSKNKKLTSKNNSDDIDKLQKEIQDLKILITNTKQEQIITERREIEIPQQIIIYINMKNKSRRPIQIIQMNNKWVGPKGEEYDHLPSEKELKLLYKD